MQKEFAVAKMEIGYYAASQEYLRNLPPAHFMVATTQSTQRAITIESLALVTAKRPDFHVFSELLVQYPIRGQRKPGQVVPDNMVVLHDGPLMPEGSYDVPLQPARPFWMLDYVSKSSQRKDYEDNMKKYERGLKVPFYLVFYPEIQELTLYRHNGKKFVSVPPGTDSHYPIPPVDIEVAILDGWVRYWFRGALLPLPGELLFQLEKTEAALVAAATERDAERKARLAAEQERDATLQELARLRAKIAHTKANGTSN